MHPLSNLFQNASNMFFNNCNKLTNFIFVRSNDIAVIMLLFNAIGLLSSHINQIKGLAKSKRENKDFLILQEKKELSLDLIFSVIPPMLLNNFLKKKLASGQWQTKEYIEKAEEFLAPITHTPKSEFGNTSHIRPIRETFFEFTADIVSKLKKHCKHLPEPISQKLSAIRSYCIKHTSKGLPKKSIEHIAAIFDDMMKKEKPPISKESLANLNFEGNSAVKEFCNQDNGLLVLVAIAYTILASNIVMPILKNKMAIKNYEKELARMGETRESIKRKKRFAYNKTPITDDTNIFNDFKTPVKSNNVFGSFNNKHISSSNLRI